MPGAFMARRNYDVVFEDERISVTQSSGALYTTESDAFSDDDDACIFAGLLKVIAAKWFRRNQHKRKGVVTSERSILYAALHGRSCIECGACNQLPS